MRVLEIGNLFKLIWWGLLVSIIVLLSGCGNGVSQEEFDAEQARVQELEVQVQDLQQQQDKGETIADVLETLTRSLGAGPSAEAILQVTALVHASGDPQLDAKWEEIGDAVSGGPPSQEALNAMGAAVEISGNLQLAEKWQAAVAALQQGEGTAEFLAFADLIQASGNPALQAALLELSEAVPRGEDPPWELFREFQALVDASGNAELKEAFRRLGEPPPEVIEEIRVKLITIGDPSLEALFEAAYESAGEELDALRLGMLAALRETLQ